jgi:hypothetical protein
MASLMWLRHKLNQEIAKGSKADQTAIKRLQKQIRAEEQKRGKRPRRGLND